MRDSNWNDKSTEGGRARGAAGSSAASASLTPSLDERLFPRLAPSGFLRRVLIFRIFQGPFLAVSSRIFLAQSSFYRISSSKMIASSFQSLRIFKTFATFFVQGERNDTGSRILPNVPLADFNESVRRAEYAPNAAQVPQRTWFVVVK